MSSVKRVAQEILDTRRLALGHATSPQLTSAALDGGLLEIKDGEGNTVGGIGLGEDGGFVIDYSGGPKPPKPSAPTVSADAGIFRIEWDGSFVNEGDEGVLATSDTDRVEIHASMDENFVPDRVESFGGAFATLDGGSFALGPLPEASTYYFRLVARSKSAQFSEPSDRVEQELAITSIDLAVTDAWLTGEAAQNTADGKNSIWRGPDEPEPDEENPFKDGDIWFEMNDEGESIPNIWDEAAGGWVSNRDARQSAIERVQAELRQDLDAVIVDGSGTSNFYKPTAPPAASAKEGDLWFDSSAAGKNAVSIFEGGKWVKISDKRLDEIKAAQAELREELNEVVENGTGTNTHYTSTKPPVASSKEGDLWFDPSDENKPYIFQGGKWITIRDHYSRPGAGEVAAGALMEGFWDNAIVDPALTGTSFGPPYTFNGTTATGSLKVIVPIVGSVDSAGKPIKGVDPFRPKSLPHVLDQTVFLTSNGGAPTAVNRMVMKTTPSTDLITFNDQVPIEAITAGGTHKINSVPDTVAQVLDAYAGGGLIEWISLTLEITLPKTKGNIFDFGSISLTAQVNSSGIASGSITEVKIDDAAISEAKLQAGAVTGTKISDNAVSTPKLVAGSVIADKIAANAVTADKVSANAITADKIAANAITAGKIAASAVEADKIKAGSIQTDHLQSKIITGDKLAVGAITASSGIIGSIDASTITVGTLNSARLAAGSITADKVLIGQGGNLLSNPNFENGSAGWSSNYPVTVGQGFNGSNFIRITQSSSTTGSYLGLNEADASYRFKVGSGLSYTISAYARSSTAIASGRAIIYVRFYSQADKAAGSYQWGTPNTIANSGYTIPADEWGLIRGMVTAPEGAVECAIGLYKATGHSTAPMDWCLPNAQQAVGSTLIQDGAITTAKIAVGAITADSGIIGSINAGVITSGTIDAARIGANTITADKVLIGGATNLIANPDFESGLGGWDSTGAVVADSAQKRSGGASLKLPAGSSGTLAVAQKQTIDVREGQVFSVSLWLRNTAEGIAGSGSGGFRIHRADTGGEISSGWKSDRNFSRSGTANSWVKIENEWTSTYTGRIYFRVAIAAAHPGDAWIDDIEFQLKVGGTLIENGAISTEHIRTGAITAESGIIGSIDANVITSGKIMGNQIDADALNGKTITGATIRTASSGSRVELTQNGLKQYNSLGATIVDMTAGSLNMLGVLRQENAVAQMEVGTSPASENSELAPGLFWSGGAFSGSPKPPAITAGRRNAPVMAEQGTGYALTMQGPNQRSMGELGDGWWRFTAHDGSPSVAWGTTYQSTSGLTSYAKSSLGTSGIKTEVERSGSSGRVTIETTATADNERSVMQLMTDSIRIQSEVAGVNNNIFLNKFQIALNADQGSVLLNSTGAKVTSDVNSVFLQAPTGTTYGHRLVNHLTTTGTANMIMATDGTVRRITSARRTKLNEAVLDEEILSLDDKLLSLTPKMWHDKAAVEALSASLDVAAEGEEFDGLVPDMPLARIPGVVAEDVEAAGLERFVTYSPGGEIESVMYDRLGIALIPVVGRLRDRIEALEARVEQLAA